jgi:hypothetical protein
MNYYLVNLSISDLMITAWCPINSLVKELSDKSQYVLPAIFCKIVVFYTGVENKNSFKKPSKTVYFKCCA